MSQFWEAVGSKLGDRWAAVSGAAIVFWLGGLLAWTRSHGGFTSLKRPADWLGHQPGPTQIAVILAILLGVVASGIVVARLAMPVLRLLEGYYWPPALAPLRRRLTARAARRADKIADRLRALQPALATGTATADERALATRLDRLYRRVPARGRRLPTRIGNTLRAAESRPLDKYGIDAVTVWPHLWLMLPENTRSELAAARTKLNQAVSAVVWGGLFLAFTPWTPWALAAGLCVATGSLLWWLPAAAEVFADLQEAAFDLHRTVLYTTLRWPKPTSPAEERVYGQQLTIYLLRGLDGNEPHFTD